MIEATFNDVPRILCELLLKVENLENLIKVPSGVKLNSEIIDTRELCKRLNVTEPTIIRWRKKGAVPYFNIGSSVRFNFEDVIDALKAKKKGASNK